MPLRIIGDGQHAAVVLEAARQCWQATRSMGFEKGRHVAIGDPRARQRASLSDEGAEPWVTVIHPAAIVSPSVPVWQGSYIGPGAIVNPGAFVGPFSLVNSGAIVEHDVVLDSFVNVNPGAVIGGGAWIGTRTVLGLGCRIRDHVRIGRDVTVGMGAVVVEDVPDGVTVMGCPAKVVE